MITLNELLHQIRPLKNRIANLVSRSTVTRVDDAKSVQEMQVLALAGESRDNIERFQNYGLTSVPLAGAESILLFIGGRRDHGIAIVTDDRRHRPKDLAAGEVALYHHSGSLILLKANGDIEITADANVKINGGSTAVAKVGSSVQAGPWVGAVLDGSGTVQVP